MHPQRYCNNNNDNDNDNENDDDDDGVTRTPKRCLQYDSTRNFYCQIDNDNDNDNDNNNNFIILVKKTGQSMN